MSIKTINRHLETQVEGLFFKKSVTTEYYTVACFVHLFTLPVKLSRNRCWRAGCTLNKPTTNLYHR